TRAATRGPDLVAEITPRGGSAVRASAQFAPLVHAHGVIGMSGPCPVAFVRLRTRGVAINAQAEGRDSAPAAIDRPALTAGRWVSPGEAVLERGFADALGVRPGQAIALNGRPFRVAGIAVSTAQCFYPINTPGV